MKIKILYISSITPETSYNTWFTFNFMETVNQLPNTEVKFYGKGIHEYYPNFIIDEYHKEITLAELYDKYNFNVIIYGNINRLNSQCIHVDKEKNILDIPVDFQDYTGLKIALEGDFQYSTLPKSKLHKSFSYIPGINLMLHRHKTTYQLACEKLPQLKHFWFPCSVNTNIFYPKKQPRIDQIAFVGHYKRDKDSLNLLKKTGFLGFIGKKYNQEYLDILQQYTMYFNHSGPFNIDNAKAFEILSSGGILITNECENGFKELFGDKTYFTYKSEEILFSVAEVYKNTFLQHKYQKNALKVIKQRHNHIIRAKELLKIIKETFDMYFKSSENNKPFLLKNINTNNVSEMDYLKENIKNMIEPATKINLVTEEDKLIFLQNLLNSGSRVCLLEDSCYEMIINKKLPEKLCIGISPMINNLSNDFVTIKRIPERTKIHHFKNITLEVPLPVVRYLINLYGKEARENLKTAGYKA
jgi:hypothetical protein